MDSRRLDDDDLFSNEAQERDPIVEMLDLMVSRGELRTIFDPVQRRLVYLNPRRVCLAFPLEWN